MAQNETQCRLLTLPRELRDLIYSLVIEERSPPPSRTFRTIPPPGTDGQLYLWSEQSTWSCLNLLSINRQIRSEIHDLNSQLGKSHKLRFELDILAKGYIYTPKWTLINLALLPQSTLDLHVNLTILSTEAFRRNDGWPRQPGHVFRTLLNFLSRFIHHGPSFLHHRPSFVTPGPHYISKLSLHVNFRDDYTRATHSETVHEIFRMLKALSMLDTATKYIGKIAVDAEWTVRGEDFRRSAMWESVSDECCESRLREDDWDEVGFHFGESWRRKYGSNKTM